MRRFIGITLAGLGGFLIVVGLLTRTYTGGHVLKFPLNEYVKTQSRGTDITYFSPSVASKVSGATLVATYTVQGDAAAGTSSTAVWNEFSYLYDVTNLTPFQWSTWRFAFDRHTADLVSCCQANLNGSSAIRQSGLAGLLWPIGTQKTTYQVFNPELQRPWPARFAGTATIDGITVYRFVEHVPPTRAGSQNLPASLVGMKGSSMVTLPQYYTGTSTFWVDPDTGLPLNTTQDLKETLRDPATGAERLVLFDGTLRFTPQSVRTMVNIDNPRRGQIQLVEVTLPLVAGLAGVVALIAGILLGRPRRGRGDRPEDADTNLPQPALGR